MTANESIEQLYKIFQKYKLNGSMDKCPCGCISAEDEQKVYSKPLRELVATDIGFYSNKAMTTWGDEDDFKHFLPRIIEIYKKDTVNGWIDLDSIHNKLSYANWREWEEVEQRQIIQFVEIDWREYVNEEVDEFWYCDIESYLKFLRFEDLMKNWNFPENKIALRNFVSFFFLNGDKILHGKSFIMKGEDRLQGLNELIRRDGLLESLEEEFFWNEKIDEDYAMEVSAVLQMIESDLKSKK